MTPGAAGCEVSRYAGADWLVESGGYGPLSPLGRVVADVLGDLVYGIYHVDRTDLEATDWSNDLWIEFRLSGGLSSHDNDSLTRLLVLATDACLRVEINPRSNRTLEVVFHQRERGTESMATQLPNLEQMIARARGESIR